MLRRTLIAGSIAGSAAAALATSVSASEAQSGDNTLNIAGVGLPIIIDGRIRNYVFVSVRLHLGGGHTPQEISPKEAYFRDALVRSGHRTPFVVADNWNRINQAALSASLMRSAVSIAGRGAVTRVEVISQAPRRTLATPRA
ncbi:hypothetical protein [uncultured Brevundimonas sp.]|uniref:hypothetical protein n=1 Tax=uncultured Brevundimonas sp. TaxID=213418 RepID=UPI0030EED307|tara:strand:- start:740 stop:1165 length:426 start_codon:yes stop_codon:yes gene_type:complete